MGEVNWSFSNSWASSMTAGGAFLGTILAASVIPAGAVPFSPGALAGLNLLFGFIIVLAPLTFSASTRINKPAPGDTGPDYAGYIGLFLVAAGLTVWATLGELATIAILLDELQSGTLSGALTWLFFALLLISIAGAGCYAWGTIRATIDYVNPPAAAAAGPEDLTPVPAIRTPRPGPLPRWNLL